MSGAKPYDDDQSAADHHGNFGTERLPQQIAEETAENGSAGVNVFDENIGAVAGKDIPKKTAADSGNDADKDYEKHIFVISGLNRHSHTADRECAEADGIGDEHYGIVDFQIFAAEPPHGRQEEKE